MQLLVNGELYRNLNILFFQVLLIMIYILFMAYLYVNIFLTGESYFFSFHNPLLLQLHRKNVLTSDGKKQGWYCIKGAKICLGVF